MKKRYPIQLELPTHCYWCGVYLMGGATRHKPDCEIEKMLRKMFSPRGRKYRPNLRQENKQ